jgi:hypothetical protein
MSGRKGERLHAGSFSTRTMKRQQNAEDGTTSCNRTEGLY